MYATGHDFTWNKLSELNMMAASKSCAVRVYVTKASVAARTGTEEANAKLGGLHQQALPCYHHLDLLRRICVKNPSDAMQFLLSKLEYF
jgi:hypothetical protein